MHVIDRRLRHMSGTGIDRACSAGPAVSALVPPEEVAFTTISAVLR
jgi:hypothetical protein